MTKQVQAGRSPRSGPELRVMAPFRLPACVSACYEPTEMEPIRTHRYDLRCIGATPDGVRDIFVAVWAGPDL